MKKQVTLEVDLKDGYEIVGTMTRYGVMRPLMQMLLILVSASLICSMATLLPEKNNEITRSVVQMFFWLTIITTAFSLIIFLILFFKDPESLKKKIYPTKQIN